LTLRLASVLAVLVLGSPAASAQPTRGQAEPPSRFPAAGEALQTLPVRAQPDPSAKVVRTIHQFRADQQFEVVLALSARRGTDGEQWFRLSLPGRPNGGRGWVRADSVDVRPMRNRIVVRLERRELELRSIATGRLLLRARVAVGRLGAETPLGRNFYVRSAFVPTDAFYGAYALETSAASRLTDWPDDGIVGIHGTNRPELLGQAVSHGCVRVANRIAQRLRRLAPLGTPIDIVR
jgi:hypothetical protein